MKWCVKNCSGDANGSPDAGATHYRPSRWHHPYASDAAKLPRMESQHTESHDRHELIARGIITRDGAILVNRSRNEKTGEEYCALPGGHIDPGESCPQALRRELQEELECDAAVGDLRFVSESIYPGRRRSETHRHEIVLLFEARLTGELRERDGQILSPESNKNFAWLPLEDIAGANLLPRAMRDFLLTFFSQHASAEHSPLYAFRDDTAS